MKREKQSLIRYKDREGNYIKVGYEGPEDDAKQETAGVYRELARQSGRETERQGAQGIEGQAEIPVAID